LLIIEEGFMQKKNMWIALVVIVIVVVGGYAIFHKSPKTPTTSTYLTPSSNSATTQTGGSYRDTSSAAVNNAVLVTKTNSNVGSYLADPSDNTLYTDGTATSNCAGPCLSAWPAYQDKGATTGLPTNVSTVTRSDNGEIQYAYKGLPLYYFGSDSPGQVTGNGVSGFSVAKP
jgi:predicted lipoprotein with Yx(FWY)xxD motif